MLADPFKPPTGGMLCISRGILRHGVSLERVDQADLSACRVSSYHPFFDRTEQR